jgi:predicted ester cyclase
MKAYQIVQEHLRAVEAGDWEKADSYIATNYTMSGTIPFPISLFVKITKKDSLRMHKPRKRALPDFKFNEKIIEENDEMVKLQVNISGTHTGVIEYNILRGVPVIQPTGKKISLPSEYFTYFVENGQIVKTIGMIPKNAGVQALVKAVS